MKRANLTEWFSTCLGTALDQLGWSVSNLSPESFLVINQHKNEVKLETLSDDNRDPGVTPRILIVDKEEGVAIETEIFFDVLPFSVAPNRLKRSILRAFEVHKLRFSDLDQDRVLRRKDYELRELIEIGKSLSAVKDVDSLLDMILEKSRKLVGADAGSIYIVEGEEQSIKDRKIRFKLSQNDSIEYESAEFVMPVSSTSITGAAIMMGCSIAIPDVRKIEKDAPYSFDSSWDERTGYQTISVLAVPMINQLGEVLGVVQLINKKRNPTVKLLSSGDFDKEVISVDKRSQVLVETLASQAGIAVENARLYDEIQNIFDGFIRASVHAIEQRDPTTSGHSFRVAQLTRKLAEVVSDTQSGRYASIHFSEEELKEIEIAGLLHDFGKVGVREEVLVKAKKLYPDSLEIVRARFNFIRRSIENDHLQRRLMMIQVGTPDEELSILDHASKRALADLDDCWHVITAANEPTVLTEGDFAKVDYVATKTYFDLDGKRQPYLKSEELKSLLVAKGSLTVEELDEIRSHAAHTISFLKEIPWGRSMRNIPSFAGAHHEKLNGNGYPLGLKDKDIPLPAKIMAVADIYDALTASDRPYKKAVSLERSLQILEFEVKDGNIDGDIVALFKKHEVWRVLESEATA